VFPLEKAIKAKEGVEYVLLSFGIQAAEHIVKNSDILLCVYRSR
jgi:hypothetical protein